MMDKGDVRPEQSPQFPWSLRMGLTLSGAGGSADCLKSWPGKHLAIIKKFWVKLFSKSFEERYLFEKM
ncbi:hypothetical protein [Komagataeibacter europaeus]|uniref:hypothetical protein n=1 Tax=Komagataeibacter europaeus TaxID=33995 RepID=UPI0002E4A9EB|nr:hypothetical protein [Komagataeibacter europaeus]